jgi:hypothetical protein
MEGRIMYCGWIAPIHGQLQEENLIQTKKRSVRRAGLSGFALGPDISKLYFMTA